MIFSWLRRRRRRKLLREPWPRPWLETLETLPLYCELADEERSTLRDIARVIVAEKSWEGLGGFELSDAVRVTIAAQAALPLLRIAHDHYRRVRSILIYPDTFVAPSTEAGVHGERAVLGLAAYRGPVVLSWTAVLEGGGNSEDGHNVVIHEFAHKLDLLDGVADGTPLLADEASLKRWTEVLSKEFARLREQKEDRRRSVLDKYGATNPAEFFAVATECFFEKPRTLARKLPELYSVLGDFYGQDPAARRQR